MRSFQRKPKAFRPNKLFEERAELREIVLAVESELLSKVETLKDGSAGVFPSSLGCGAN